VNATDPARRILVVEDEPKLSALLCEYLRSQGYAHHVIGDGLQVIPWVREHTPDLILLDLMLPGKDGLTLCRELRAFSEVAIIMLTARVEEVDRLLGLDLGADDYICKPFSPREVMARIRAIFRRLERQASPEPHEAGLCVEPDRQAIQFHGQPLDLTTTEYRILSLMASRPGRVFSRDRLLDCLHDEGQSASDRAIDTHIKNIRRKLARINPEREILLSVYGAGYKLEG